MTLISNIKQEKIVNYGSLQHSMQVEKSRDRRTMKCLIALQICAAVVTILLISTFYLTVYPSIKEKKHTPSTNPIQKDNTVTLYAIHPTRHSFCFRDGQNGGIIINWAVYNRCNDLDFNNYYTGYFTVGVGSGRAGTIIDLGSRDDLQKKYEYQETVGHGQGYASIHRTNKTLLILKDSYRNHTFQAMDESAALFRDTSSSFSIRVILGHVYALRITDTYKHKSERVVKMLVLAYQPNESVTIQWEILK
ncbi:unnamed protein product [Adineta steineri]|uniref:Uncharacterized protein n=1 Tax=Adineta steineri TaxID=433720 RepID=A0A819SN78_9BILA|nr:unnamed protein product [Adineta steineri]CAF1294952.1 unnamed protein product [Adineta steineri]CAF3920330.1 unnamed protein product [Adineta steineri]CAF4073755.1 unnamed protein product [Adineta steineri]